MSEGIHAYLIVGGTVKERQRRAQELLALEDLAPQPDQYILEKGEERSVGIEKIRELEHHLSLKIKKGGTKKVLLLEAQNLTKEAQNSLLKTLEEPPQATVFVLTAPHRDLLLPTVVSRCQVEELGKKNGVDLSGEDYTQAKKIYLELSRKNLAARLDWAEKNKQRLSNREEVKELLAFWMATQRELLLKSQDQQYLRELREVTKESLHLFQLISETNVSPRLALEYLLLKLPQLPKRGATSA